MTLTTIYAVRVFGTPVAQPRARAMSVGGKARVYNPTTAREWKETIQSAFMRERKAVITGAVVLDVLFYMPRPKRLKGTDCIPHTAKPDKDNLEKAVMDALTDIGIWEDDRQVYGGTVEKWYTPVGTAPGARIIVKERIP